MISAEVRFWNKVNGRYTKGCWIWVGANNGTGYGVFRASKRIYVHRFSYELVHGPIQENLQIDHLCRNRGCVNPDHLEAVTARINTMRGEGPCGKNMRKTHCIHGHALTVESIFRRKDGRRECKECHRFRRKL